MSEHDQDLAFLRQCILHCDSAERHKVEESIAHLQRDERAVRRAVGLMCPAAPALQFSAGKDDRTAVVGCGKRKPARKPKRALPRGIQHPDNRRQGGGGWGTPLKKQSASGSIILSQITRRNTNQFGPPSRGDSGLFNLLLRRSAVFGPLAGIYQHSNAQSIGPTPSLWTILSCEERPLTPATKEAVRRLL